MGFRLRKLYADIVGKDGTLVIAYATEVQAFGLSQAPSGIEYYSANGDRLIQRGLCLSSVDEILDAGSHKDFAFEVDGDRVELTTQPLHCGFSPACPDELGFRWQCLHAKNESTLRRSSDQPSQLEGIGYIDYVELTRAPRALRLSTLDWGRLHLQGGSIVFTKVTRTRGAEFAAACIWRDDQEKPVQITEFHLEHPDAAPLQLRLQTPQGEVIATLMPERVLHHGGAADNARFPSLVERAFYSLIAGPINESRWLSRVHCDALGNGWAVHESVRFSH